MTYNATRNAYDKLKSTKYGEHKAIFNAIDDVVSKYITAFKMYETVRPTNNVRSVELMKEASLAKMREADGEVSKYKISVLPKLSISAADKEIFMKYLESIRPYYNHLIREGMRTVDKTRRNVNRERRTLEYKLGAVGVPSEKAAAAAAAATNAALNAYAGAGAPPPARAPVPGVRYTHGKRRGGRRAQRRSTRRQRH